MQSPSTTTWTPRIWDRYSAFANVLLFMLLYVGANFMGYFVRVYRAGGVVALQTLPVREAAALMPSEWVEYGGATVAGLVSVAFVGIVLRGHSWQDLGFRRTTAQWIGWAIGLGFLYYIAMYIVYIPIIWIKQNLLADWLRDSGLITYPYLRVVLTSLAVPFWEELFFRGFLYAWLRQSYSAKQSLLVSTVIFAALHWFSPAALVGGLLMGGLFERSRSLWPSIILHGLYNSLTGIVGLLK